jgi:hypothetical protein
MGKHGRLGLSHGFAARRTGILHSAEVEEAVHKVEAHFLVKVGAVIGGLAISAVSTDNDFAAKVRFIRRKCHHIGWRGVLKADGMDIDHFLFRGEKDGNITWRQGVRQGRSGSPKERADLAERVAEGFMPAVQEEPPGRAWGR